jgi:hypothetical protein
LKLSIKLKTLFKKIFKKTEVDLMKVLFKRKEEKRREKKKKCN